MNGYNHYSTCILFSYFDSLMRSRMIEAKFLIDRAKKINDRVDVEGEMGKLRIKNGELRMKN